MCESALKPQTVPAAGESVPIPSDQLVNHLDPVLAKLSILETIAEAHTKLLHEILRRLPEVPEKPINSSGVSTARESTYVTALKAFDQKLGTARKEGPVCESHATQTESIRLVTSQKQALREGSVGAQVNAIVERIRSQNAPPTNQLNEIKPRLQEEETAQKGPNDSTPPLSPKREKAASPSVKTPKVAEVQVIPDQRDHEKGVSSPRPCPWTSAKKWRVSKYRAWREIEASPFTPHANNAVTLGAGKPDNSPMSDLHETSTDSYEPQFIWPRNATTIRAACRWTSEEEDEDMSPIQFMATDDRCYLCLMQKTESMHFVKPALHRLECGHEFHLHCLSEVVQRRECRKECAICLLALSRGELAKIFALSKQTQRHPEIRIYQDELFNALTQLTLVRDRLSLQHF